MPRDVPDTPVGASAPDRVRSVLSELEEADFALIDPPPEVWERIEAAIDPGRVESAKEPPSRPDAPANRAFYSRPIHNYGHQHRTNRFP